MIKKVVKKSEFENKKMLEKKITEPTKHRVVDVDVKSGGVINKKTLEARTRAEIIIDEAEKEAIDIKKIAQKILDEVQAVREAEKNKGFEEGKQKGLAEVTSKLVELKRLQEEFYNNAEKDIIELVLAVSEKAIGDIVNEHPSVIQNVVRQALERSLGDRITVKINPEDYKTITKENFEFKDILDRTKRLLFKEDETIAKGGCVVETEVGTIDAQIETQLEAIRKALEI